MAFGPAQRCWTLPVLTSSERSARQLARACGALECGSLLPLSSPRACLRDFQTAPVSRYLAIERSSQQAGWGESGSKLPHSKAPPAPLIAWEPGDDLVTLVFARRKIGARTPPPLETCITK
jgi:hypothetical protein